MNTAPISIIVPAYNSAGFLTGLLGSVARQRFECEVIINDDTRTDDETAEVVERFRRQGLDITLLKENRSRAQARNAAAGHATGECLLILDSDMELGEGLLAECAEKAAQGYDALVIPEESFGSTFWAECRWLEKKCYEGVDEIEALRFVRADVFYLVGGYSNELVHREDKDLDLRVRSVARRVGRTEAYIYHNEGALRLLEAARKKAYYGRTAHLYAEKQPDAFAWEMNPANRYLLFVKNRRYVCSYPLQFVGLIVLKTVEFAAAGVAHLLFRLRSHG